MEKRQQDEQYRTRHRVAEGVWRLRHIFVNVYFVQNEIDDSWVLVDTGLKTAAAKIKNTAAKLFGENVPPTAIVLTHGHFDHTGSLQKLLEDWRVPVYAHDLEKPYLTGMSSYPPPDTTASNGLMARTSFTYPLKPIDISANLAVLPEDGSVPPMPEWGCVYTPGHAPGHISLFRPNDGTLIVGDAFLTAHQETIVGTFLQPKVMTGPPKHFTYDWFAAADSVRKLAALEPKIALTGHGKPMRGQQLYTKLQWLANNFEQVAVPKKGKYVKQPAWVNEEGVLVVPD
jgi:glyoxylase-like metal-dependent hydrolase (beta-lactamase superfamily II)